jgi:hypothetical protein
MNLWEMAKIGFSALIAVCFSTFIFQNKKMKKNFLVILTSSFLSLHSYSQNCNLISNGNFESPVITTSPGFYTSAQMSGWQTMAPDGKMELWQSGFYGFGSFSGGQHLEIDAYYDSTVFQNITVSPGSQLAISFAHRGRMGVDTMSVLAGPVGGPYTTLGIFADDTAAWGYYTVNYLVPNSGTNYSIRFNPIYGTGIIPGYGNFLDSVTVCLTSVGINEITTNENSVARFPNPSNDYLSLIYYSQINEPSVSISIFNSNGALMKKIIVDLITGRNKIDLNLKALNEGIYFIKLGDGNNIPAKKWVKF